MFLNAGFWLFMSSDTSQYWYAWIYAKMGSGVIANSCSFNSNCSISWDFTANSTRFVWVSDGNMTVTGWIINTASVKHIWFIIKWSSIYASANINWTSIETYMTNNSSVQAVRFVRNTNWTQVTFYAYWTNWTLINTTIMTVTTWVIQNWTFSWITAWSTTASSPRYLFLQSAYFSNNE